MNFYKYNKMRNEAAFACWTIVNIVLTLAYILEIFKGNRTLYYTTEFLLFDWMPLIICYAISLIIGRGNTNIKYGVVVGYLIFYTYALLTTQSMATFTYIFPMMCAIIVYDDINITHIATVIPAILNIVLVLYNVMVLGPIDVETITFYEIQIACLVLCTVFLHKTSTVLIYGNRKLNKLNDEISKDELTGVYNRYFLKKFINDKFKSMKFSEVTMAIIDIDNFKGINDNYGHKFGDLVLRKIATILETSAEGNEDTYIIRIGGDEFIMLSSVLDKDKMYEIAMSACEKITNTKLHYGEAEVNFTVSIGVASSTDSDGEPTYNKLYEAADQMLYTVKLDGKNSVAVKES